MTGLRRTSGIDEDDPVLRLNVRMMGMAVNNGVNSGGGRIEVESVNVMQGEQFDLVDGEEICRWQFIRPTTLVHITPHRYDRRHSFQNLENVRCIDIAGVDNHIDALQRFDCMRIEIAVGIGYKSNTGDSVFC